ncbi:MAG: ribosomal protein S18 acetylase RimI-like enzyme [Arenicella sp.]
MLINLSSSHFGAAIAISNWKYYFKKMTLIIPTISHYSELLSWIASADQLTNWAGPNIAYPSKVELLINDLQAKGWSSFSLISKKHQLLAFGQYYRRQGCCHLCRLIVSPKHRGKGLVETLIEGISLEGYRELGVNACSLFVYSDNSSAIKAYQKIGFAVAQYPADDAMDNCLYMIKG